MTVAALDLLAEADVIDLHVESFIWTRVFGYDLQRWHQRPPSAIGCWVRPTCPACVAAGVTGAGDEHRHQPVAHDGWSAAGRCSANLDRLRATLDGRAASMWCADATGYRAARAGGRAGRLPRPPGRQRPRRPTICADPRLADVSRITLVHLTRSRSGHGQRARGRRRRSHREGAGSSRPCGPRRSCSTWPTPRPARSGTPSTSRDGPPRRRLPHRRARRAAVVAQPRRRSDPRRRRGGRRRRRHAPPRVPRPARAVGHRRRRRRATSPTSSTSAARTPLPSAPTSTASSCRRVTSPRCSTSAASCRPCSTPGSSGGSSGAQRCWV